MRSPESRKPRADRSAPSEVPTFKNEAEAAAFWDSHSPLDYPGEWVEAKKVEVKRPLGHILAVRLDAGTIDKLAALARRKGLGPSTLARMWLLERLAEIEEQAQASSNPA